MTRSKPKCPYCNHPMKKTKRKKTKRKSSLKGGFTPSLLCVAGGCGPAAGSIIAGGAAVGATALGLKKIKKSFKTRSSSLRTKNKNKDKMNFEYKINGKKYKYSIVRDHKKITIKNNKNKKKKTKTYKTIEEAKEIYQTEIQKCKDKNYIKC